MKCHQLACVIVSGFLAGPVTADVVTDWNEIAAAAVAAGRPGAIGQTDLALVQAAVHDAIQAYERRFEPYYAEVRPAGSKRAAAVAAAHGVLVAFYPAQATTLDATYDSYLLRKGLTGNAGLAVGDSVAAMIVPLRRVDPNPLPEPVLGSTGIGQWRPTDSYLPTPPPTLAPMATPWLGKFDPFTLTGPARFRAPLPPELTSDRYATDYNEVKLKGARLNSTRSAEQTDIAYFWTDNFSVQWNRAIRAIIVEHVPETGDRARLLALANLAGADALITCWDSKLHYLFWRPVTAIRNGDADGNSKTAGDTEWQSLVNNPNYPDYTSGANNITGAITRTLALFFGTDSMSFEVTSLAPLATRKTRSFSSFSAAAQQVVNARIYLGIHFRFADNAARLQGQKVAEFVQDHFLLPVAD